MKPTEIPPPRRPLITLVRPILPGAARSPWPRRAGLQLRHWAGPADSARWLEIQNEWLAERGAPAGWGPATWARELRNRPWWRPESLLLAGPPGIEPVGCVALEQVAGDNGAQLHWLAVRRDWRRQGIARALVEWASQRAGQAGYAELRAETLRDWEVSVRFYYALGFREQCGP